MRIYELTPKNAPFVAKMLARLKPEWFDVDDTLKAITAPDIVGWCMGESDDAPVGFVSAKVLASYSGIELQNYGYDDNGVFVTGEKLALLFDEAEKYAVAKGYRLAWTILSWADEQGFSNYVDELSKIIKYTEELVKNKKNNSNVFNYLLDRGYRPAGFMPNCYEVSLHGVMFLKNLHE